MRWEGEWEPGDERRERPPCRWAGCMEMTNAPRRIRTVFPSCHSEGQSPVGISCVIVQNRTAYQEIAASAYGLLAMTAVIGTRSFCLWCVCGHPGRGVPTVKPVGATLAVVPGPRHACRGGLPQGQPLREESVSLHKSPEPCKIPHPAKQNGGSLIIRQFPPAPGGRSVRRPGHMLRRSRIFSRGTAPAAGRSRPPGSGRT